MQMKSSAGNWTHNKRSTARCSSAYRTVQELGRNRERKGNRLGKAAARLGEEQEYLRHDS